MMVSSVLGWYFFGTVQCIQIVFWYEISCSNFLISSSTLFLLAVGDNVITYVLCWGSATACVYLYVLIIVYVV